MKRIIAMLLGCMMLLGAAWAVAEDASVGKTLVVKGDFALTAKIPEGYTVEVDKLDSTLVRLHLIHEDETKPDIVCTVAYSEEFDDLSLNDLSDEAIEGLVAETMEMFTDAKMSEQTTEHGTKLIGISENSEALSQFDIFTLYKGFFLEVLVTAQEGTQLTDEQLLMANQLLSDMWFLKNENISTEESPDVMLLDEYHGVGSEDSWAD